MRQNLSRGVVLAAAATGIMSLYASPALADSNATATASNSPGVGSGNNVQVPVNVPLNICGNTVDIVAALNPAFGNSCANGPVSQGRHAAPHHPAQHDAGPAQHLGRGADHGGRPDGDTAGRGAERGGHGGPSGEHAGQGGHGGEHRGQGGYGDEHRGQGGYGDERGGYGDSGYGDSGYGHSGRTSPGNGHPGARHADDRSGSSSYGGTHGSPGVLSGDLVAVPVDVPVELCGNTLDVIGLLNPVFGNSCGHHHTPQAHQRTPDDCPPPAAPPRTPARHTPPVKVHEQPPAPPTVPRQYTPPTLAETGSEGVLINAGISAALLVGGTLLYRRSRAQSRP
ncbi:chaplin [Streptomyces sp. NPDC058751]|uniref:chaplin n=1 Tax=Streptomyces sp. NPDC058751 TaxID=3346623 RepID=UPI00367C0F69